MVGKGSILEPTAAPVNGPQKLAEAVTLSLPVAICNAPPTMPAAIAADPEIC